MKNKLVSFALLTLFSIPAHAAVEVSASIANYKYAEVDNAGAAFMSLSGNEISGDVLISEEIDVDSSIKFRETVGFGILDYWSNGTGNSIGNTNVRIDSAVMYDAAMQADGDIFIRVGVGHRYLHNNLRGFTTTNSLGYLRTNHLFYVPVGVRMEHAFVDDMTLDAEYDHMIKGTQKTAKSDVSPTLMDVTNNQSSGYGIRLSGKRMLDGFSVGVFYQYWNIKASDVAMVYDNTGAAVGNASEPANTTKTLGMSLSRTF